MEGHLASCHASSQGAGADTIRFLVRSASAPLPKQANLLETLRNSVAKSVVRANKATFSSPIRFRPSVRGKLLFTLLHDNTLSSQTLVYFHISPITHHNGHARVEPLQHGTRSVRHDRRTEAAAATAAAVNAPEISHDESCGP
ncbi:hypothetical protein CDD83_1821 [Cordyceps sp. RAO-2017]|nr:hypothetical protein CDD83_1821 [Cordyceps sp. RAO-2017]